MGCNFIYLVTLRPCKKRRFRHTQTLEMRVHREKTMSRGNKGVIVYQPRRDLRENQPCQHLEFRLLPSRPVRK